MSFMNEVHKTLGDEYNYSVTENGALGYRTTQSALLDLNFKVVSLRSAPEEEILRDFTRAFYENKKLAIKWLFFARDVRGGLGERRLFRVVTNYLCKDQPELMVELIPYIAEYGRFDDLWSLMGTPVEDKVIGFIRKTLLDDLEKMHKNEPCSLLAKWMPSINASSEKTTSMARYLASKLGMREPMYRKTLSKLRKYLKVVEIQMSSNNWSGINYEAVPSKANLKYNSAFLRHDETRRREFLSALEKGEAKINSSVAYPHDIVHSYANGSYSSVKNYDPALEGMWKSLPSPEEDCGDTLVVRDGSYSMTCSIGGSKVTALEVATALAVYFSEKCTGQYKDQFITFSKYPKAISLSNLKNLHDKLSRTYAEDDCSNTDIYAVFNMILTSAIHGRLRQDELPKRILILSDMEFDANRFNFSERLFSTIEREYHREGYELPKLIFWNLNSRTGTIPVTQNNLGVELVSGFSVNLMKMIMSNQTDPYQILTETLNSERYSFIDKIMD